MIELSGLRPDEDVAIDIVGPRPGEKIHEELFGGHERGVPTEAERILRADRPPISAQTVDEAFDRINLLVLEGDAAGLADEVAPSSLPPAVTARSARPRTRNAPRVTLDHAAGPRRHLAP